MQFFHKFKAIIDYPAIRKTTWILVSFGLATLALRLLFWGAVSPVRADPNFPTRRLFGNGTASDTTLGVVLGDMNEDGYLDVVVGNDGQQSTVYLNDGKGGFYNGPTACAGIASLRCFGDDTDQTQYVAVGDMNGDGHLDVIVSNRNGPNIIYFNDGTANFYHSSAPCTQPTAECFGPTMNGAAIQSLAIGDVNGDRKLDVVVGVDGLTNTVYFNMGGGNFYYGLTPCSSPNARCFGTGSDPTHSIILADLNEDGYLDAVVGNATDPNDEPNVVYINNGTGAFYMGPVDCNMPAVMRCVGYDNEYTSSLGAGDINSDGHLDLIVANSGNQSAVYRNDGSGYFYSDAVNVCDDDIGVYCFGNDSDDVNSVALADMNLDSDLDLIVGTDGHENIVYLTDNDGASKFHYGTATCGLSPGVRCFGPGNNQMQSVAAGDVNGDGQLDIVAVSNGRGNFIYFNDTVGDLDVTRDIGSGGEETWSVALGDMNGDSRLDLVVGNIDQQSAVYLNNGTGSFSWGPCNTSGVRCFGIADTI